MRKNKAIKEENNLYRHELAKVRERYIYEVLIRAGILVHDFDGDVYINEGKYMGRYKVQAIEKELK